MDIIALVAVMGISLALIFGLPFGIAQYSYHLLKGNNIPFYFRWIALIPALLLLYFLNIMVLPDKHMYNLDYVEIVAYPIPENANIFYSTSNQFGKHRGDFSFGMQTSPERFINIRDLLKRRGFAKDSITQIPDTIQSYFRKNELKIIQKLALTRYSNYNYYADFASDSSTIFMRKVPK